MGHQIPGDGTGRVEVGDRFSIFINPLADLGGYLVLLVNGALRSCDLVANTSPKRSRVPAYWARVRFQDIMGVYGVVKCVLCAAAREPPTPKLWPRQSLLLAEN